MDEDVEFRDMIFKKLEENGSLLDIKAKLRAHLYDVIENDGKLSEDNDNEITYNCDKSEVDEQTDDLKEQNTDNRTLSLSLVLDLLDCLNLAYSKRVLIAESGIKNSFARDRLRKEILQEQTEEKCEYSKDKREAILYEFLDQHRARSPCASKLVEPIIEDNATI
ncbi:uncharacterized protein LOC131429568 [Malaya genurostris]|uniref:uncharacterized protein LOC131429568 n=1 Tax=Malaya genurostris TaxID=325434 RepID=UPI0026F3E43F|nr:uncharacterized protein LOC131429568 [Malaya genurostris]